MNHVSPFSGPPRVPPVEPELLASAVFHFAEYLEQLAREAPPPEEEEEALEDDGPAIDTRQVLDLFAEELGTNVQVTLNLYMRVTALFRLLAASPGLARLAVDQEEVGGPLSEDALLAAARLELHVNRTGGDAAADFDPREFRAALDQD